MKVLSLFAGLGAFELGLERTGGFEVVAQCEIDAHCRQILQKHWPKVPRYDDVRTLTAKQLAADGITIDVICGGWPCQDLSTSGSGLGLAGERSGLWYEFARLIGEIRPKFVIMENSPELLAGWMGDVLGTLASLRYDAEWHCIPLGNTGAPHGRDRVWILAYPAGFRQQGQGQLVKSVHSTPEAYREADQLKHAFREGNLPFMCGGHDGAAPFVDRPAIAALGNAVGPAIPEMLGRAILEGMNNGR